MIESKTWNISSKDRIKLFVEFINKQPSENKAIVEESSFHGGVLLNFKDKNE